MVSSQLAKKGFLKRSYRNISKRKFLIASGKMLGLGRDLDLDLNDRITVIKQIVADVCSKERSFPIPLSMFKSERVGGQFYCFVRQMAIYFSFKYCRLGTQKEIGQRFNRNYVTVGRADLALSSQIMGLDPKSRRFYQLFLECKKRINEHPAFGYMRPSQSQLHELSEPASA